MINFDSNKLQVALKNILKFTSSADDDDYDYYYYYLRVRRKCNITIINYCNYGYYDY